MSGSLLASWRSSGRALKARRGEDQRDVIATVRASRNGMACRGGVDAGRSVSCARALRPGRAWRWSRGRGGCARHDGSSEASSVGDAHGGGGNVARHDVHHVQWREREGLGTVQCDQGQC